MIRPIILTATFLLAASIGRAQTTPVSTYIQQVAKGWSTDAKKALPDLLIDRPDDPGVMFLHAALVDDPQRALPLLERIVQTYPSSEWADDALSRVILMACVAKDAAKAKAQFAKMRDQYANSPLLPITYDALRMTVGVPAATETAPSPSQPTGETSAAGEKTYTINAGSFASKADAQKLMDVFAAKRIRARLAEKWANGKRSWVVQVGEYDSEVAAAKEIALIKSVCSCKPVVAKR